MKLLKSQLLEWFRKPSNTSVSRAHFSREVLKRSPGTFCDLLNKGQAPKTKTGRSVWRIIEEFLDDSEKQEELRLSVAHAERSNVF